MYQPNDKYNSDHNNFQKGEKKEEEWLETWSKKWFDWVSSDNTMVKTFFMVSQVCCLNPTSYFNS